MSAGTYENLTRDEAIEKMERMESRLDNFGALLTKFKDRLEEAEAENEQLRETVDEQSREIDDLHRERIRLARRLDAVEQEVGIDVSTAQAISKGATRSPLHLLETIGPRAITDNPGATLYRARVLLEKADQWGETRRNPKYGKHRLLATAAHDLKQRLEDARDEELQWRQVYLAMEKIDSLGGDHVELVDSYESKKQNYGKALVWREVET